MLHRDIRKKQPTAWPWVAGLAVLALLGWGVSALLAPPPPELEPETDAAVEIRRPAPIPNTHRQRFVPESPGLDALAPLAGDDAGERVQVEGEVLAVTDEAFWILVDRRVL
ncbi:MAG: hypothetical protein GWM90_09600, partial [Gemmatimonadetes bacterium]|nr:hypothetical protein [Gemmatimonadota bacterium]NIR36509.1 hypothetical protein [Actinomycetota bacterium]NIU74351.1 hypothetical protein [Gammaproteobacteria bacterium]NIQ54157.1 hypothetical protein [Gemmatimonadota bacterium]NIX44358.1 hypothetical protein [Gemmatimonadota bacterium]